jgi:hypothetical protein
MNLQPLTDWFAAHHPSVEVDRERWTRVLNTHQPHELTDVLAVWHEVTPDLIPTPAQVNDMLRTHREGERAATDRERADRARAATRAKWDEQRKTLDLRRRAS